jgi:hypothetical protein
MKKEIEKPKLPELNPESILLYSPKLRILYLNGQQISDLEAHSLQEEVKFLERTKVWDIIQNSLGKQAMNIMFENAKALDTIYDDEKVGKAMRLGSAILMSLEIQKKILEIIKEWKPKEVPKSVVSPLPRNQETEAPMPEH